jgi:hypothetical protein
MDAINKRWRKSSYSGNGGNCVEVADRDNAVLVRDTTNQTGAVLRFAPGAWRRYVARVKGECSLANSWPGTLRCHCRA